jgi:uncharacterized protein DUF3108
MRRVEVIGLLALVVTAAPIARAQQRDSLPFVCGERLAFRIRSTKIGNVGRAVMALSGPVDIRGTGTMLASFDASAGIAFFKGSDATRSWFDPEHMTSLRYQKRERRPFSTNDDSVEIYADRHEWDAKGGESGAVESDHPLDELAFIYYLRTVTLLPDSLYSFDRHYDKRRAPNTVRVVGHEQITTPAGEFSAVQYQVTMSDSRDLKSRDVINFWISEDHRRLPVRIESVMPVLGKSIMTLESVTAPGCRYAAIK